MPRATNTINGKAFEYACMNALYRCAHTAGKSVSVIAGSSVTIAERAYRSMSPIEQRNLDDAADTAVRMIVPLEPKLLNGSGTLLLQIATDAMAVGVDGDVRDVFCIRDDMDEWKIGFSCKHNHEALRHPRITEGKDFGWDWIGIHCSQQFIDEITPIINSLVTYGRSGVLWRTIPNKQIDYYAPILGAYIDEIARMCATYADVPAKLLRYFFGANDFYKVIMRSSYRTTTIEGFNMSGTLGTACGRIRPITRVPVLRMPTRLLDARFKQGSLTTIILTFDEGWAVRMRLHNKDDVARPTSLAWDVQLEGLPPYTYINTQPW